MSFDEVIYEKIYCWWVQNEYNEMNEDFLTVRLKWIIFEETCFKVKQILVMKDVFLLVVVV